MVIKQIRIFDRMIIIEIIQKNKKKNVCNDDRPYFFMKP